MTYTTKVNFQFAVELPARLHQSYQEAEDHSDRIALIAVELLVEAMGLRVADDEVWCPVDMLHTLPQALKSVHWIKRRGTDEARATLIDLIDALRGIVCPVSLGQNKPERKRPALRLL